jgi:hypothetical protein
MCLLYGLTPPHRKGNLHFVYAFAIDGALFAGYDKRSNEVIPWAFCGDFSMAAMAATT